MTTLTLQSRVLALAGIGVFAAGSALAMLSRHSLLAIEASAAREQARAASFAARAVARDALADLEALQGAVSAPRVGETDGDHRAREAALAAAVRRFRLADAVCFTGRDGVPILGEPEDAASRFSAPAFAAAARDALASRRPAFSPFVSSGDGEDAVAVVPLADGSGAAAAIVNARGHRVEALLQRSAGAALTTREASAAAVAPGLRLASAPIDGTPWAVTLVEPVSGEIARFRHRSLWLAPSLSLLAVMMAWAIVLSVRRPVRALTSAAERIAGGDLTQPIAGGDDEIGRLAIALENMRGQMQRWMESAGQANAVLEARVRQRTAQLGRVLRTVISAQEDERRRVARELHDETSQLVAALAMTIDAGIVAARPPNPADLRVLVDRMHDGLHRVIVNLRPSILDDLGLAAAIEWLAEHELRHGGINARCELGDLQECRADPAIEIAVFRVVQESITNVVRHANASSVLIQGGLASSLNGVIGRHLWIELEDDGDGFEPGSITANSETLRGVGLLGMRERVELVGGTLQIDSAPGEGTRVRLDAPLRLDDEDLPV